MAKRKRKMVSNKKPVKAKMGKKQVKLIAAIKANPNGTYEEWGVSAGYQYNPKQSAFKALQSDVVQDELETLRYMMDARKKLSFVGMLDKLEELLEADKVTVTEEGKKYKTPDNPSRGKALKLPFKVRGMLKTNVEIHRHENTFQKFEAQGMIFTDQQLAQIAKGNAVPSDFIKKGMELKNLEAISE